MKKLLIALLGINALLIALLTSQTAQAAWTKSENSRVRALEKQLAELKNSLLESNDELAALRDSVEPAIFLASALEPWEAMDFNYLSPSLGACPKWSKLYGQYGETSQGKIYICNITALVRKYR